VVQTRILVPQRAVSGKTPRFLLFMSRAGTKIGSKGFSKKPVVHPATQESLAEGRSREPRSRSREMRDVELMVKDYRLTTAEILYHMPDHPSLLQTYVWQDLDIAPKFPILHKFLDFWESSLDGRLHSVKIASARLVQPSRFRYASALMRLH
jgi:uncharacterized protein Usg